MKKKILILLSLFCSLFCLGQTVSTKQLAGTSWNLISPKLEECYMTIKFTTDTMTYIDQYPVLNKTTVLNEQYYISSAEPTSFVKTLVGKSLSGNYIAEYNGSDLMWFKVEKISNDSLYVSNDEDDVFIFKKQ